MTQLISRHLYRSWRGRFGTRPPKKVLESTKLSKWQLVWHSLDREDTKPTIVNPRYCAEKFHYYARLGWKDGKTKLYDMVGKHTCSNADVFAKIGRIPRTEKRHLKDDAVADDEVPAGDDWYEISNYDTLALDSFYRVGRFTAEPATGYICSLGFGQQLYLLPTACGCTWSVFFPY